MDYILGFYILSLNFIIILCGSWLSMSNVHGLVGEHSIHGRSLFNADFDGDVMNTFAFMIDERQGRLGACMCFSVRTKFPRCRTVYHQRSRVC